MVSIQSRFNTQWPFWGNLGHIPGAGRENKAETEDLIRIPNRKQIQSN